MHADPKNARHGPLFPGFDGLRLISAIAVIVSHAFEIAEGNYEREPIHYLLGRWILGDFAVFTFFVISGFLLARSLANGADALQFSINRVLRILPGFTFCILTTAFVIGPLVTSLTLRSYLGQEQTYGYVTSTLLCLCPSWESPFVFAGHSKLAGTMNGSLWSLPFEVLSYVFLLWLSMLLRVPWLVAAAFATTSLLTVFVAPVARILVGIAYTLPYFSGGVIMYVIYARFGTRTTLAWIALAALCLSPLVGRENYAFAIFGSYIVVHLAQRDNIGSTLARKWGDLSYGLYLFGWPVTAAIRHFAGTDSGWVLIAYSLPLTSLAAAVSWWAIERPCIGLKNVFRRMHRIKPFPAGGT